jgi:hypothetical protein
MVVASELAGKMMLVTSVQKEAIEPVAQYPLTLIKKKGKGKRYNACETG